MKFRGLVLAALVLAILGGVLYWSEHRKPKEDNSKLSASSSPAILKLSPSAITQLTFKRKSEEPVTLAKVNAGKWQITTPKTFGADQDTVSGILSTLSSLNSDRLVENQATDLKQYGLDQPSLELDIAEKDNKSQKLLIGDQTPTSGSFYTMVAGSPQIFTLAEFNKSSIDKSLNDLRDKRLLTLNSEKVSLVELNHKGQDIEFSQNKEGWQIIKPKPLRSDTFAISELVHQLTDAKMDLSGSGNTDLAPAFVHATPVATAKVTDNTGTQELQIRKDKDQYYAKSSAVDGVYKISADLGQAVDKNLEDFRNKKIFDFSFNDPNKIELHVGSKAYFFTRSGEDWWSNGKKMNADDVESLVSKLRDLTAIQFVESGFTTPSIQATVTSNDGKRVEKISFAKTGNGYIAKRDDDSSLYQLDANPVDELQKAVDEIKPATAQHK